MNFIIRNPDNMRLLIKSVKILTQYHEYLLIQFYKTKIRICQQFQDGTSYFFDFKKEWFDSFQYPEELE